MNNLRIVTLNVRGLKGNKRYSIYITGLKTTNLIYVWCKKVIVQKNLLLKLKKGGMVIDLLQLSFSQMQNDLLLVGIWNVSRKRSNTAVISQLE